MASLTQWRWVWINSGSWWWTGRPGVLWSIGSRAVRHDWATKLDWTELNCTEHRSDYRRLYYGRHVQQSLLLCNLQLSISLKYMPIFISFPDWWLVEALFWTEHNQEKETGSKKESWVVIRTHSGLPHSMSWKICLLELQLSCNLSLALNFSLLFQIFAVMRQE